MIFCHSDVPSGVKPFRVVSVNARGEAQVPTGELDLLDELECLRFGSNVISGNIAVHKSDLNAILVEERSGVGYTGHDTAHD